jgi:hypothetical protein
MKYLAKGKFPLTTEEEVSVYRNVEETENSHVMDNPLRILFTKMVNLIHICAKTSYIIGFRHKLEE